MSQMPPSLIAFARTPAEVHSDLPCGDASTGECVAIVAVGKGDLPMRRPSPARFKRFLGTMIYKREEFSLRF